jgi:peptide-methionine (S)-S-oxide reductase
MEALFLRLKGVHSVVSGYSGGDVQNPTYREVCSGTTGHAEVVQVTFDPVEISLGQILDVFFRVHDPTTLNRQGNDVGSQYRSVIFYRTDEQHQVALQKKEEAEKEDIWSDPIVTEITPFERFFPAEGVHQDFFANNPDQPYCVAVIDPKVRKLMRDFSDKVRP